jgi:hypothetical protein
MKKISYDGRDYFAGLRVTKRKKAMALLTLTLLQTPTLTLILTLTLTLPLTKCHSEVSEIVDVHVGTRNNQLV